MLLLTTLLLATQHAPPSYDSLEFKEPVSVLMLENSRHVPTVEVMINGKGPYRFGIDTGASGGGRIDPQIADETGCPVAGDVLSADGIGRNSRTVHLYRADKLSIGGLSFKGAILGERPSGIGRDPSAPMDGILGFGLWSKLLLTLDYPRSRVEIRPGAVKKGDDTVLFADLRGIPSVEATVCGHKVAFDFDSGNSGAMGFPSGYADRFPLDGPLRDGGSAHTAYNTFKIQSGTIDGDLVLAGQTVEKPRANFGALSRPNIGYDILRRFRVTVDEGHKLIKLDPQNSDADR